MVQGLAFLSKKSWHTKNKANQEKVWIAEQRKEQETAKANELAREIQQEREAEELNRIAGKKSIKDRGIDWMYQEGTSTELAKEDAAKKAEEYLLGKEYVGAGAQQGDFDDGNQNEGIHSALNMTESAGLSTQSQGNDAAVGPDHNSVQYRNENFRKRVEDPMFFVAQKEQEKRDKHEQTKALYHRVVGHGDEEHSDDKSSSSTVSRKREKKDRKRRKKKKKKKSSRSNSRHYHDEPESRRSHRQRGHRRRSRSRSRSRSNDRYDRDYDSSSSYEAYRRHRRRSRSRSRSRSNDRHGQGYGSWGSYDNHQERNGDNGNRNQYHNKRNRRDDDYNRRFTTKDGHNKMSDRSSSRHGRRNDIVDVERIPRTSVLQSDQDNRPRKIDGYGLKGAVPRNIGNRDIGPNRDLIRRKKEEQQSLRNRNMQISRSRKKMTNEERTAALQEMQADARKREDRMVQKASHSKDDKEDEMGSISKKGASFLNEITSRVNGIASTEHSSLSSRVAQNRHTNQRLHDSFL